MNISRNNKKGSVQTQTQPVDVETFEGENRVPPEPAINQEEVTPNEAFSWDVTGNQSPCKSALTMEDQSLVN